MHLAGCDFVSSSYIAPEMRALDAAAKTAGIASMYDVGLDPGFDHLVAHYLVDDCRESDSFDPKNGLYFIFSCGGVPKTPKLFLYNFIKFPLGVLKAPRTPFKSIREFKELDVALPWDAISIYNAPLAHEEALEDYPNPDRLPFMEEHNCAKDWKVKQFVRGTLRLDASGDDTGSAMARLGSIPVSLVIQSVLDGKIEAGVQPAPSDMPIVRAGLRESIHWHSTCRQLTIFKLSGWSGAAKGSAFRNLFQQKTPEIVSDAFSVPRIPQC